MLAGVSVAVVDAAGGRVSGGTAFTGGEQSGVGSPALAFAALLGGLPIVFLGGLVLAGFALKERLGGAKARSSWDEEPPAGRGVHQKVTARGCSSAAPQGGNTLQYILELCGAGVLNRSGRKRGIVECRVRSSLIELRPTEMTLWDAHVPCCCGCPAPHSGGSSAA